MTDHVTVDGGGGPTAAFEGRLVLRWTDTTGDHSTILEGVLLLGSAEDVGIRVRDPRVSRVHAEVEPRPDGLLVRDLGSKNGTFYAVVRIERALLPDGATFRVGDTDMRVVSERAPAAAPAKGVTSFHGLVGQSPQSRALFALLERIAASEAPALVSGETGTGKELVARALHDASPRRDRPFVIVDCAALPEALLEAELFGHARGAFTGATSQRIGAFEAAEGGTVFLDEIGELPLPMQPKLLRVLEARSIRRIGETAQRAIDVRFVAATHRDLPAMVARGTFREDLYFRLSVLPVRLAPLRDRPEDLPLLLAQLERRLGRPIALDLRQRLKLASFPWPGNVRELRNFVDRVAALGAEEAFFGIEGEGSRSEAPVPVPASGATTPEAGGPYRTFREEWARAGDRAFVHALLERHGGNVVEAAAEAQIDKSYFYRLVRREK